ncbi:hypothetical protein GCM10027067_14660 [Pseudactinotalea suaedae]
MSDAEAIAAARSALDPSLTVPVTPGVEAWRLRWSCICLVDDVGLVAPGKEADLLLRAGRAARLARRPGSVGFEAGPSAYELADAFGAAGLDYALTGDAGANLYRSSAGEAWPVLYVDDIERAAEAGGLVRKEVGTFGMRVTLIPFDGVSELGRARINSVVAAARDQVILDAYGGIDRMAEPGRHPAGAPNRMTECRRPTR